MTTSKLLPLPLENYASSASISEHLIGTISADRSAIVGREGWCFIYEGSNDYRDAYLDATLANLGEQWARLIEVRRQRCEALGALFIQLVVPNKATLMPEYFPEPLGEGVTTILERLLACRVDAHLLCPIEALRAEGLRESVFRRNDSHLTLAGNAVLVEMLLSAAGLGGVRPATIETRPVYHTGDLGCKFAEPIPERFHAPRFDTGLLNQVRITKTLDIAAEGFTGIRQSFLNPSAPIRKSVLVFGNSFFERVPSWGMSPIFAALFEEFHFVWTPGFIQDEVCSLKPDLVLSQTCERFLTKVPI